MFLLTIIWIMLWLFVLAGVLSRNDLEPVTKLTWVLVIILVPVFGVIFYWINVPAPKAQPGSAIPPKPEPLSGKVYEDENYKKQPTVCIACKTEIPAGATACPKCGWSYLKAG